MRLASLDMRSAELGHSSLRLLHPPHFAMQSIPSVVPRQTQMLSDPVVVIRATGCAHLNISLMPPLPTYVEIFIFTHTHTQTHTQQVKSHWIMHLLLLAPFSVKWRPVMSELHNAFSLCMLFLNSTESAQKKGNYISVTAWHSADAQIHLASPRYSQPRLFWPAKWRLAFHSDLGDNRDFNDVVFAALLLHKHI